MKRSPMKRGKPLARGAGLKRTGPVKPKRDTPRRGRIVLGPTARQELRHAAYQRGGYRCEAGVTNECPGRLSPDAFEWHHRKLRSQGGGDTPTNSLCLCSWCHAWAHAHPAEARALGLIVRQGRDPADVAVTLADGRVVRLNRDMTYDLIFDTPTTNADESVQP